MRITTITKRVQVVTGKYDSVVVTPFGRFTVDSHEDGIAAAQAYINQYK
jgi:hypothetical protein